MERSSFLYQVVSSQRRCPVPTALYSPNGYGCMAYVPMLWYDDQQVFTSAQLKHFVHTFQNIPGTHTHSASWRSSATASGASAHS